MGERGGRCCALLGDAAAWLHPTTAGCFQEVLSAKGGDPVRELFLGTRIKILVFDTGVLLSSILCSLQGVLYDF